MAQKPADKTVGKALATTGGSTISSLVLRHLTQDCSNSGQEVACNQNLNDLQEQWT